MDKTKKTQHGAAKKRKAAHRVFALLISALVVIGIAFAAVLIIKRINTVARKKSLPIRPETEYAYTGDGFVYIEGKTLNFYSVKNEDKNYSMSVEADNVKLVGTDKIKVIYTLFVQIIATRFDKHVDGELKKIVAEIIRCSLPQKRKRNALFARFQFVRNAMLAAGFQHDLHYRFRF